MFEIVDNQFKFLYDSDYLYGEDANYDFADNEKILIQTFRTGSWYKENAETFRKIMVRDAEREENRILT